MLHRGMSSALFLAARVLHKVRFPRAVLMFAAAFLPVGVIDVKEEVLTLVAWQKGNGKNKKVSNKFLLHIVSNAFFLSL